MNLQPSRPQTSPVPRRLRAGIAGPHLCARHLGGFGVASGFGGRLWGSYFPVLGGSGYLATHAKCSFSPPASPFKYPNRIIIRLELAGSQRLARN